MPTSTRGYVHPAGLGSPGICIVTAPSEMWGAHSTARVWDCRLTVTTQVCLWLQPEESSPRRSAGERHMVVWLALELWSLVWESGRTHCCFLLSLLSPLAPRRGLACVFLTQTPPSFILESHHPHPHLQHKSQPNSAALNVVLSPETANI